MDRGIKLVCSAVLLGATFALAACSSTGDGVGKSWAVTRGPSLDPKDRRLAVEVEDHPIEYGTFEGTIPQGEYGGGTVMLWDRGHWKPHGDPAKAHKKGHISFEFEGERLKGGFSLVRMPDRDGGKSAK